MRVLIVDSIEPGPRGRMIGQLAITLDDDIIDAHGLREPLDSLARALIVQYAEEGGYGQQGRRVVGVDIKTLDVVLILQ